MLAVAFGLLMVVSSSSVVSAAETDAITLQASESLSTAGYFNLSWDKSAQNHDFVLQQASSRGFDSPVEWRLGKTASFSMSGLENGTYYYRVGYWPKPQAWSNVVQVQVQHHSLGKAFAIFSLGALIFLVLVVVILINRKQANRGF
ncbi:MAG: hypothetical protein MI976_05105 [Pseudomonadales bacterium]|nr:hypothetical protein [Pseudomonadales bacterium]